MPQELMTAIRLRRVMRFGMMPDVLGGVEDPESQSIQKIPGGQQAHHRAKGEARALPQKVGDILQLRDAVRAVVAVLLEEGEDVQVLPAGVRRVFVH